MNDIPEMDLEEFRDFGYLAEANRVFFHPLGLALAVQVGGEGGCTGLVVLDDRSDSEGWVFSNVDDELINKVERVQAEWEERGLTRIPALGRMIQSTTRGTK